MKTDLCKGCYNDFYNGHNELGVQECWSLKNAKIVKRWRLPWWTEPTVPGAFTQVEIYDCRHEPGKFAFLEELPTHAANPRFLE